MDTKEKEDLKRRQNLSHEAGTFLDLLFLNRPSLNLLLLKGALMLVTSHFCVYISCIVALVRFQIFIRMCEKFRKSRQAKKGKEELHLLTF